MRGGRSNYIPRNEPRSVDQTCISGAIHYRGRIEYRAYDRPSATDDVYLVGYQSRNKTKDGGSGMTTDGDWKGS